MCGVIIGKDSCYGWRRSHRKRRGTRNRENTTYSLSISLSSASSRSSSRSCVDHRPIHHVSPRRIVLISYGERGLVLLISTTRRIHTHKVPIKIQHHLFHPYPSISNLARMVGRLKAPSTQDQIQKTILADGVYTEPKVIALEAYVDLQVRRDVWGKGDQCGSEGCVRHTFSPAYSLILHNGRASA